jgi:hypothetical protein
MSPGFTVYAGDVEALDDFLRADDGVRHNPAPVCRAAPHKGREARDLVALDALVQEHELTRLGGNIYTQTYVMKIETTKN